MCIELQVREKSKQNIFMQNKKLIKKRKEKKIKKTITKVNKSLKRYQI